MKTVRRIRNNNGGFTLIELLVAFTLFGMLFSVLYGGLRLGARTSTAVSVVARQNHADYTGRDVLRRSIENALFFSRAVDAQSFGEEATYAASFEGGPDRLRYVSEVTSPDGVLRPYVFELKFDETSEAISLYYSKGGPVRQSWNSQLLQKAVLLEDVSGLSIEYLAKKTGAADTWHLEWRDRPRAPDLVKVSVAAGNRWWPDLLVSPVNTLDIRNIDNAM